MTQPGRGQQGVLAIGGASLRGRVSGILPFRASHPEVQWCSYGGTAGQGVDFWVFWGNYVMFSAHKT